MKAFVNDRYGPPDVLRLAEIATPDPTPGQARIRIHAVSINGSDREGLVGRPFYARMNGLLRPGNPVLGSDIAGVVESIGADHAEFKPGDEVFGEIPGYKGGFAEYVCTHGRTLAPKPEALTFEQAAAIPQGAVIAWNGIVKKGGVEAGQQVLVNGAGGSGGAFAVQLAKRAGAEVTAVDNAGKQDFLRSLRADRVLDYARENFTRTRDRYDLILDLIAHRSAFSVARALNPGGVYFVVGGSVRVLLQVVLLGPLIRRTRGVHVRLLIVPQNRADLLAVTELVLSGEIRPVIDRVFPFEETAEAMRYVSNGQAKGKVVIGLIR
jgi:NADPH:quinone reductase-like Zn-dependent oxidoreductase